MAEKKREPKQQPQKLGNQAETQTAHSQLNEFKLKVLFENSHRFLQKATNQPVLILWNNLAEPHQILGFQTGHKLQALRKQQMNSISQFILK